VSVLWAERGDKYELDETAHCQRENLKTPPIELTIGEAIFSHGRSHTVLEGIVDFSDAEHNRRGARSFNKGTLTNGVDS
jgi:hypothetical protein